MKEKVIGSNVAVIGGGLAGLTAANFLARAGFSVTLFEKSSAIGGRAKGSISLVVSAEAPDGGKGRTEVSYFIR